MITMLDQKLCYVSGELAYFSVLDPEEVSGDDWNDAPYEHNASTPHDKTILVRFDSGDLLEPSYSHTNSPFTVEEINRGVIAWLRSASYCKHKVKIMAGTTLREFIQIFKGLEYSVYLPVMEMSLDELIEVKKLVG